jgi:drug/metabolite transporter (DMT)-like permease
MLLLIIMNLSYALLFPLSKIALEYASPIFLTGFRMTLAGILVLLYHYFLRGQPFTFPREHIKLIFLSSFMGVYVTNVLDFWGFNYMTATKSCFLYNLYPFASAFFAWFYFSERLNKIKWLGLSLGFLGALPMIFTSPEIGSVPHFSGSLPLPELAVLVAIVASTYGCVCTRKLVCEANFDPIMINGFIMFFGGIMALGHSALVETWHPLPISNFSGFLVSALGMMFVSNVIGNTVYVELLRRYSMTFISFTAFSEPLITAVFDWLFFNIKVHYTFYISIAIVFVGLYLFYKDELAAQEQESTSS